MGLGKMPVPTTGKAILDNQAWTDYREHEISSYTIIEISSSLPIPMCHARRSSATNPQIYMTRSPARRTVQTRPGQQSLTLSTGDCFWGAA